MCEGTKRRLREIRRLRRTVRERERLVPVRRGGSEFCGELIGRK